MKKFKIKKIRLINFNHISSLFKKNKQSFSLLIILFSTYLLIGFVSFFLNWKIDDDIVTSQKFSEIIFNPEIKNIIGGFGAYISNLLIKNWFGISAFLIPFTLIIISLNILGWKHIRFQDIFFKVILLLMIIPIIICHFFNGIIMAGGVGIFLNDLLNTVIGRLGNSLLLITVFIIYLITSFNITKTIKIFRSYLINNKNNEQEEIIKDVIVEQDKNKSTENSQDLDHLEKNNKEDNIEITENTTNTFNNKENNQEKEIKIGINKIEEEEVLKNSDIKKKLEEMEDYDPTLELSQYKMPGIEILKNYGDSKIEIDKNELEEKKNKIVETLGHYKINITSITATIGPTITLYEIVPDAGVRISKIKNLEDDIALSLAAEGIRIIAPIPGKGTVGIEVPNKNKTTVSMLEVLRSEKFQNSKMELPIAFGKTISNETFIVDLAKMPHLLMAGATGQGKSVGLNVILTSLLYKKHPSQIKFVLVDPKKVELTLFNKIERHYLAKLPDSEEAIITDTKKVINTVNSLCIEMDERYELCKTAHCRNIKEYNEKFISRKLNPNKGHRYLPYIVLVIDEFADLIMTAGKEIETPIARLAQLARAIGIHLIIATQRPSVNVITGIIKANFPARVAFRVTSSTDSRTIMDSKGAEQLIGMGDMLISTGSDLTRLQCAFVDTPEVEKICEFIGSQRAYPQAHILPEFEAEKEINNNTSLDDKDDLFNDAASIVVKHQSGSTSLIQRKLRLGYNRAGRIIDQLEAAGIVGPFEGSKARQVLIKNDIDLEDLLKKIDNE